MVVPAHPLECVLAPVTGLEVVVKRVSANLSQMGVGLHVMHLALSYSFLCHLHVYTVRDVLCIVCTMSTVNHCLHCAQCWYCVYCTFINCVSVCTVCTEYTVCLYVYTASILCVLCVLCVLCAFHVLCILHVLHLFCSAVMTPQCFIGHHLNLFSLNS